MNEVEFAQGDRVVADIGKAEINGTIVGQSSVNIIDFWIVQADEEFIPTLDQLGYKFSCFTAPGPLITLLD